MKLEDHRNVLSEHATIESLAPAVSKLTDIGEAYIILSSGPEEYVQAAGTMGEDFIVERRDGCAGEHYRGDRRITAAELVTLLDGYLRGSSDWSHCISWHHVNVGENAPLREN